MNSPISDRNRKAVENGQFCEDYAKRQLPGLKWVDGIYDAVFNGLPIDIKGCEVYYSRGDRGSKRRSGMVMLNEGQNREIGNGWYFIVVHYGELVVKSFFVQASKVEFDKPLKQLAWTTMQKLAVAV